MKFKNKFKIGDEVKSDFLLNPIKGHIVSIYSKFNWTNDVIEYFEYDILFTNKFGLNQVERLSEKWIKIC